MKLQISASKYLLTLILFIGIQFLGVSLCAQPRKQTNWLTEKQDFDQRWRIGFGANIGEPTGLHVQFYRLCRICKQSIAITKKFSVDASVSTEGFLFSRFVEKRNPNWERGGVRAGIDAKLYFKMPLNPYVGIGAELGTRTLDGSSDFYPDVVARFGIEQKLFGIKFSPTSFLNSAFFVEGKFNKCITSDFSYFLPSFGLRFHFL